MAYSPSSNINYGNVNQDLYQPSGVADPSGPTQLESVYLKRKAVEHRKLLEGFLIKVQDLSFTISLALKNLEDI